MANTEPLNWTRVEISNKDYFSKHQAHIYYQSEYKSMIIPEHWFMIDWLDSVLRRIGNISAI